MLVKIAPLGERVTEVNIASGTSVGEALRIAGVEINGRTITVNDSDASLMTPIQQDGAVVALINKMKGGR